MIYSSTLGLVDSSCGDTNQTSISRYSFDSSVAAFLHKVTLMVAINHLGYVAGLLTSTPDLALRTAAAFLTVGGIFVAKSS